MTFYYMFHYEPFYVSELPRSGKEQPNSSSSWIDWVVLGWRSVLFFNGIYVWWVLKWSPHAM